MKSNMISLYLYILYMCNVISMIASYQLSLGTSCCVSVPSFSIVKAVYMSTCMNTPNKCFRTAVIVIITQRDCPRKGGYVNDL